MWTILGDGNLLNISEIFQMRVIVVSSSDDGDVCVLMAIPSNPLFQNVEVYRGSTVECITKRTHIMLDLTARGMLVGDVAQEGV